VQPVGGSPSAEYFFETYLAAPIIIALWVFWKCWTRFEGPIWVAYRDMDLETGRREFEDREPLPERKKSIANLPLRTIRNLV
jgi:amino acid transporter